MTGSPGSRSRTLKKYCTDNRNAKIRKDDLTHRTVPGTKIGGTGQVRLPEVKARHSPHP
jgi:hypothetical protein